MVDDLDMAILSELSADASISVPKLSERIKANPSVVYARIKKMVKGRLIERYTIVVNSQELGYAVKALVGLNMDTKKRDNAIGALFETPGVSEVAEVTGRFDILVTVYARALEDMHRIVSDGIGKIDGVVSSESFIEMKSRERAMPYRPPA